MEWASDDVIDFVAEILVAHQVKATWFITHDSPSVQNLFNYPNLFELGIHPNFLQNSTQGENEKAILDNLLTIVPKAKSCRTHSLFQSSPLLKRLCVDYGIENDSSIFLPGTPHIVPHKLIYSNKQLTRIPYLWGDYTEMNGLAPNFSLSGRFQYEGVKLFCFHPMHIAVNAKSGTYYDQIKKEKDIKKVTLKELGNYTNNTAPGVLDFFKELISEIKASDNENSLTLNEISEIWKSQRI